ncbi:Hydroquinone glucosyltransferase [Morus notabilis]|uniref:Glycosyltransferase n=1 Tax=Morus notabilis TaxID=981085 RepID=W9QHL6_9ROSA|nr:Hydroquinone glucosyltransferase [Morus notabilis]
MVRKRLISHHRFHVTCIIPTIGPPSTALKQVLNDDQTNPNDSKLDVVYLHPVNFHDLAAVKAETQVFLAITRSLSPLREVLKSLKANYSENLVGLVVDGFGTDAFDIAEELNLSSYIFFTSSAMILSFCLELPQLDERVTGEYRAMGEPVRLPSCVPVHGGDLLDPVQDRSNLAYKLMVYHTNRFRLADGIILNSFIELEEGAIQALLKEERHASKPPVYPVGPLIRTGLSGPVLEDQSECLKWLDGQPSGSVLFVSFGSGGTLSFRQMNELALGLEMSGQRFLWVVRSPNDKVSNGSFFSLRNDNDPFAFLPNGFLETTKARGLVVTSWAPQAQVLAHISTGGFLTHCGWNSTLESVVHGVPLIAWPLYAEQKMNAVLLTESAQIALRPKVNDENGLVGRGEIAQIVKSLMEGEEGKRLRERVKEVKNAAQKVVGEHGSSTKALADLALKLKKRTCLYK